jgi:hypothetical protein
MAFNLAQFMQTQTTPSRKSNKVKSGRSGRKSYNGQKALAAVGGRRNTTDAIYAPPETHLCKVVSSDVGWNEDGTPRREPRW